MVFPFLPGEIPPAEKLGEGPNSYDPALSATTATPVLGDEGFLTGKWWRSILTVTAIVDLSIDSTGTIQGTSWRITLPVPPHSIHIGGVLNGPSDAIGSFQTRGGTSGQATTGSVLLDSEGRMIFYGEGKLSSIGSDDFTTTARIKAIVNYAAEPGT